MASNCCCENALDIGCGTACSDLTITTVAPVDGMYELRSISPYQHAESITLFAGDLLVFSLKNFNPNALHSLQLYMNGVRVSLEDADDNIYDCLQLRTLISGTTLAPTIDLIIV